MLFVAVVSFSFSPRNGEVILKTVVESTTELVAGFSPRNGEVILK